MEKQVVILLTPLPMMTNVTMITMLLISERLSQFTNELGEKQTCNVEMRHLYKRIYFNPGLGPPPAASSQETAEEGMQ